MNNRIERAIKESIKEELDIQLFAIEHNITNLISGLLYSLQFEIEKDGKASGIHDLVRLVVRTSRYKGPEGEEYPVWDDNSDKAQYLLERLSKALQNHGVKQAWDVRKTH